MQVVPGLAPRLPVRECVVLGRRPQLEPLLRRRRQVGLRLVQGSLARRESVVPAGAARDEEVQPRVLPAVRPVPVRAPQVRALRVRLRRRGRREEGVVSVAVCERVRVAGDRLVLRQHLAPRGHALRRCAQVCVDTREPEPYLRFTESPAEPQTPNSYPSQSRLAQTWVVEGSLGGHRVSGSVDPRGTGRGSLVKVERAKDVPTILLISLTTEKHEKDAG